MSRRTSPRFVMALCVLSVPLAVAAGACGLESNGLGELDAGSSATEGDGARADEDAGGQSQPPPPNEGGTSDAGVDAAQPGDGCASSVEVCNNGVDDNCNGLVDCADPQCGAWACTGGPVPTGWTLQEVSATAASCSEGYGSSTALYTGTFPPATCGCAAAVTTPGSCTSGSLKVSGNGTTGAAGCAAYDVPFSGNDGGCLALAPSPGLTPPAGETLAVTAAPYSPGACTPAPTTEVAPAAASGQACELVAAVGGGCAAAGVCAPAVTGGYRSCIAHAGSVPCPAGIGFDAQQIAGTGVDDTRGCSACTTSPPTAVCGSPELTLFTDSTCTKGAATVQADGVCGPFPGAGPGAPTWQAQKYSATVQNETCTPSAVTPTGSVALTGTVTFCCR